MINPLFKVFGSKWMSSRLLPLPEYDTIVEPFAGGAGYSLRHHERSVILYETDNNVFDLWNWLINHATEAEIRAIPLGLEIGTNIMDLPLTWGQRLLLKNWQRTNNVGECWTISKWGHLPGMWTANCRARVAEEFQAIKHWKICRGGYEQAFKDIHYPCTWFVDPPYLYNYRYRQPAIDYAELAHGCLSANGLVIACEAVCPKTGAVPDYLPFQPWADRINSRRGAGHRSYSKELICVLDNSC